MFIFKSYFRLSVLVQVRCWLVSNVEKDLMEAFIVIIIPFDS